MAGIIAGLRTADSAYINLDDRVLIDTGKNIFVPPHARGIGFVFQEHRLFAHMTVRENLFFARTVGHRACHLDSRRLIDTLGIGHLLERMPDSLSGGESQRVALGRALLAAQSLLIMDEPLASLDPERRRELLIYFKRVLDLTRVPVLYITHSHDEAKFLANNVLKLDKGKCLSLTRLSPDAGNDSMESHHDLTPFD